MSWSRFQVSQVSDSFAIKGAPTSWSSAYKNVWGTQFAVGPHLNSSTYNYGILVNTTGYYECRAVQRSNQSADTYIGIGIDGSRSALEDRTTGEWSHNHVGYANSYTESTWFGLLNANEIITAGAPDTTTRDRLTFASSGYAGFLVIKLMYLSTS